MPNLENINLNEISDKLYILSHMMEDNREYDIPYPTGEDSDNYRSYSDTTTLTKLEVIEYANNIRKNNWGDYSLINIMQMANSVYRIIQDDK